MVLDVEREQALAYRLAAQQLDRGAKAVGDLDVFDLGVQDTMGNAAKLALLARLDSTVDGIVDDSFALLWTFRGAPHWHRRSELRTLAEALWPLGEPDAMARALWQRGQVTKSGLCGMEAIEFTATAMREAITGPMSKGEASTAVTAGVPAGLTSYCRGCDAIHIYDQLMRIAALPAGIQHQADSSPLTLIPIPRWKGPPTKPKGTSAYVEAYLRLLGPATQSDVAGYFGTTATQIKEVWPDGLVEVRVDGRKAWLPESRLSLLRKPPEPDYVRLLPPLDPYLQARDRALAVPEKAHQKELWRILGNPGALLVEGEIVGTWRAKAGGKKRLEITVTPFDAPVNAHRAEIEAEAERVAAHRGASDLTLTLA